MEFVFRGIDGTNLLGFLATLGAFRSLAEENSEVTLRWSDERNGTSRPMLRHPEAASEKELVQILARTLRLGSDPVECLEKWKNLPRSAEFAEYQVRVRENANEANLAFVTALGSASISQGDEPVGDTGFRTMGGAGHQDFLGFMAEIHRQTTAFHLDAALFHRWSYEDVGLAMRWDSGDYRPHALRAEDPSKGSEKVVSVRGANRLAVEALPMFPVLQGTYRNSTVGFQSTTVQWPIWDCALSLQTVQSLLFCCPGWVKRVRESKQRRSPNKADDRRQLVGRGIHSIWESTRFTEGKFRNFKPAARVF